MWAYRGLCVCVCVLSLSLGSGSCYFCYWLVTAKANEWILQQSPSTRTNTYVYNLVNWICYVRCLLNWCVHVSMVVSSTFMHVFSVFQANSIMVNALTICSYSFVLCHSLSLSLSLFSPKDATEWEYRLCGKFATNLRKTITETDFNASSVVLAITIWRQIISFYLLKQTLHFAIKCRLWSQLTGGK